MEEYRAATLWEQRVGGSNPSASPTLERRHHSWAADGPRYERRGVPNTVLGFNIHGLLGEFTCWTAIR